MNSNAKRRSREAIRNADRYYFKFITKYVEGLHNDVFKEARALYEKTKKINPTVKDLTKTVQFMSTVTPTEEIPRHYKRRKETVVKHDNILQPLLNIPLIPSTIEQPLTTEQTLPDELPFPLLTTEQPLTTEQTLPDELPFPILTTEQPTTTEQPLPDESPLTTEQPLPMEQPFPLIPQDVYTDLLADLVKDPELYRILNDFPFTNNNEDLCDIEIQ